MHSLKNMNRLNYPVLMMIVTVERVTMTLMISLRMLRTSLKLAEGWLSISISLCVHVSIPISLSVSVFISLCLTLSLSPYISLSLSLSDSLSLPHSLSPLSLSPSLSLYLVTMKSDNASNDLISLSLHFENS